MRLLRLIFGILLLILSYFIYKQGYLLVNQVLQNPFMAYGVLVTLTVSCVLIAFFLLTARAIFLKLFWAFGNF